MSNFFSNVVIFLRAGLPFYTDLLSEKVSNSMVLFDGIHSTITTSSEHNLKIGDYVIIENVKYVYPISNIIYDNLTGILTGSLDENHQIVKNDKTVILQGDFIGEVSLLELDNDNNIRLCLPVGLTINTLEITKVLSRFINDYFRVDDVIDNFNYKVLYDKDLTSLVEGGNTVFESRVDGGYSVNNYIKNYALRNGVNQDVLYVEYNDNEISRSNSSTTDFNQSAEKNSAYWLTNRDNITVYYISNTTSESSKVDFVDRGSRIIRNAILKVLLNNPETDVDSRFNLTYDGGEIEEIEENKSNLSVFSYKFYLQFTFSSNLYYNKYLVQRIKNIHTNIKYNVIEKECN